MMLLWWGWNICTILQKYFSPKQCKHRILPYRYLLYRSPFTEFHNFFTFDDANTILLHRQIFIHTTKVFEHTENRDTIEKMKKYTFMVRYRTVLGVEIFFEENYLNFLKIIFYVRDYKLIFVRFNVKRTIINPRCKKSHSTFDKINLIRSVLARMKYVCKLYTEILI